MREIMKLKTADEQTSQKKIGKIERYFKVIPFGMR